MQNVKSLIESIGRRPLTAEERHEIGTIWHKLDIITQMEIAARIRGVSHSKCDIKQQYLEVFDIMIDFNHRYGKSPIHGGDYETSEEE
mgnify:CR=1 FL=1